MTSVELARTAVEDLERLVGPWRWMLVVYEYREEEDRVVVVTVQDARSSTAVTAT